ncbi:hypothetical protein [Pseudolactococcus carnosus]|uniref:Uncharacterized protein n=1 Tax=Pseudolactococcus carnosus TaxID=2749961 RepID=A0ABT0AV19_9LACT|nr:hypothetical protein [Lactococcus carnosus]MCJ1990528.1 hypothetical protein [Lactococcus carnosus]
MTEKNSEITKQDIADIQKSLTDFVEIYQKNSEEDKQDKTKSVEQYKIQNKAILDKFDAVKATPTNADNNETLKVLKRIDSKLDAVIYQNSFTLQADIAVFTVMTLTVIGFMFYVTVYKMVKNAVTA